MNKITKEQVNPAKQFLESKQKGGVCPWCEENSEWIMPPFLYAVEAIGEDKNFIGKGTPVVAMHCNNCGYLMLFNAITTQIVEADDPY